MIDAKQFSRFMQDLALVYQRDRLADFKAEVSSIVSEIHAAELHATHHEQISVSALANEAAELLGEHPAHCRVAARAFIYGNQARDVAEALRFFVKREQLEPARQVRR